MHVIPKYLIVVNQNLGIFPLKYITNADGNEFLQFSRNLFIRSILIVSFIIASALTALYFDLELYFAGQKAIHMKSNAHVLVADKLSLTTDMVVVFSQTVKKHSQFMGMCYNLQSTDKALRILVQHSTFKWRSLVAYACITVLVSVEVLGRMFDYRYILYLPVLCINIMQAAWFLQFTFLVEAITARFEKINKMIEIEIRKDILQQNIKSKNVSNYASKRVNSFSEKDPTFFVGFYHFN